MRILLFGGSGQVGLALQRTRVADIIAPGHGEIDLLDNAAITGAVLSSRADLVINAAAYTDVDGAERERDLAYRINAAAPGVIAAACARADLPLIHLSTDYVFDGEGSLPLDESAPTNPLNVYGLAKLQGERAVRAATDRHIVIRLASVFGPDGRNFLKTMVRLLRTQKVVRVAADQVSCPTPAAAIADMLCALTVRMTSESFSAWGTYHFAGAPAVSWYEFACAIRDAAAYRENIRAVLEPTHLSALPRPAVRPLRTLLDCSRIQCTFGVEQPQWAASLAEVLRKIS